MYLSKSKGIFIYQIIVINVCHFRDKRNYVQKLNLTKFREKSPTFISGGMNRANLLTIMNYIGKIKS